jgi:hypothetical protein
LDNAQHLIDALTKDYTIKINWDATKYIGFAIEWDYTTGRYIYTCQDTYQKCCYDSIKHSTPKKKQNLPHPHIAPQYGAKNSIHRG